MTTVVAAVLLVLAVLLLSHPAARSVRTQVGTAAPGPARPRHARSLRPGRARWRGAGPGPDVGMLVAEVATRLRAGADVESAWAAAWRRTDRPLPGGSLVAPDGVPEPLRELAGRPGAGSGAVPGAIAACRLTHELGAPLAPVLEQCAHGLADAAQAQRARSVALAGPRSTARLLGALPVIGLLLGGAAGADPVAVFLDGGLGTGCLVSGLALLALGHLWSMRLVRAAEAGGER